MTERPPVPAIYRRALLQRLEADPAWQEAEPDDGRFPTVATARCALEGWKDAVAAA
ncbi:MAG: hypothetical protein ACLUVV_02910 [Christensenellales bacterium]